MKQRTTETDKNKRVLARIMLTAAAVFTALAIAVTCGVCFDFSQPVIGGEAVGSATTSTTYSNKTDLNGKISNGDIINYSAGSNYTVSIGPGSYTFYAWGAQGAGSNASSAGGSGGKGGYTYATYTTTAATTIYIYVGTTGVAGNNDTAAVNNGGYNGGGASGWNGGGGGGATHFATASGLLSALSGNTGAVLIVAGGGGGAQNRSGGGGGGGNNNGAACPSGSYGTGGCGGGVNGAHGSPNGSHSSGSQSGYFGQGGPGQKGGDGNWGGAGGGGYYGGCGTLTDGSVVDDKGGGGGSGYIKSGLSGGGTSDEHTGDGAARIVADSVNTNPKSRDPITNYNVNARGVGSTTAVTATGIATDSDTGQTVYFSSGSPSDYDAYNSTSNQGLYVDSGFATSANKYFTWTWQSNSQLTITGVVLFPRPGVDGAAASGNNVVITLYTKVRDNYNSNVTRGVATVSFTVTVPPAATPTLKTTTNYTNTVAIGTSTTTSAPLDPAAATGIYNPTASRPTLFIKKALVVNTPFTTIYASDLINLPSGLGTDTHTPVISINSTSTIIGNARKYKINEVDSGPTVTAYNSSKGQIPNAYSQLTITCLSPDTNYQVLPITIYLVEKTTAYGGAFPNVVPNIGTVALDIVFKMENTRPVLKSGQSNLVDVKVNETLNLSLGTYFYDADAPSGITSATHTITNVVVPSGEFIQLTKQKNIVAATNYNVGSEKGDGTTFSASAQGSTATNFNSNIAVIGSGDTREAFMRVTYSADVLTVTGVRSSYSQYSAARANALGHFYLLLQMRDVRDPADLGIWLPIAFRVGYTESYAPVATITDPTSAMTGQNRSTLYPKADGSAGDSFYFAPMAINYNGSNVVGQYLNDSGTLTNSDLQPLALDGDNFTVVSGASSWNGGKLNEFLQLNVLTPESIVNSVSATGNRYDPSTGIAENQYISAQLIDIYYNKSLFATETHSGSRVVVKSDTATDNGFKYVALSSAPAPNDGAYFVAKGLKITLKSATMNRYFYASVPVKDVTNASVNVDIAIRVNNTGVAALAAASNKVATFGNKATDPEYSEYDSAGTPTFTYKIPLGATVMLTPYDFVRDADIANAGVRNLDGAFTLNGLRGVIKDGVFTVGATTAPNGAMTFNGIFGAAYRGTAYTDGIAAILNDTKNKAVVNRVSATVSGTAYGSTINNAQSVFNDRLFFARRTGSSDSYTYDPNTYNDFDVSLSGVSLYMDVAYGNAINIAGTDYPLDFLALRTTKRTLGSSVIMLTVRDRYGDSSDGASTIAVKLIIDVVNTKPVLVDPNRRTELAVTAIRDGSDAVVLPDSDVFTANGNGEATGLMSDHDHDIPEFMITRGVLVANSKDLYTNQITSFVDVDSSYLTDGGRSLTTFVSAEIVTRGEEKVLVVRALSSTKAIQGGVYVYFYVTDNNGGVSLGYVQIEVKNTNPILNTSETDGFSAADPRWLIESTSASDISRHRYIVGSQSAKEKVKAVSPISTMAALDVDIKVLATDADAHHDKLVLSQHSVSSTGVVSYVNLTFDRDTPDAPIPASNFEIAVPKVIEATSFVDAGASVAVFTNKANVRQNRLPTEYLAELMFFVDGSWKRRVDLINYLKDKTIAEISDVFDSDGRWIVTDWALHLVASGGFVNDEDVGIAIAVRDSASLGGDTAGVPTAYTTDRSATPTNKESVDGMLSTVVYQHITQTGIRSVNEYLGKNNNYYYVEYTNAAAQSVKYISTYDGDVNSVYGAGVSDIVVNGTTIKTRTAGNADGTLAGVNSGVIYSDGMNNVDGAFRYTDVIEIPAKEIAENASGDNEHPEYAPVYVPMSYFGLLRDMTQPTAAGQSAAQGTVNYVDSYIGYDAAASGLGNINDFSSAISISDGTTLWTGSTLANNPYVYISAFYDDISGNTDLSTTKAGSSHYFTTDENSEYSRPYYNNRLAVTTVNATGELIGYQDYNSNKKNFVDDGKLMYLEKQSTMLKEHNFGLRFAKKYTRTGSHTLTLSIKLARWNGNTITAAGNDTRCTADLKIHIQNSQVDLYAAADNSGSVRYDEQKGTYYVDVDMSSSESRLFGLMRRSKGTGTTETIEGYGTAGKPAITSIAYIDNDYGSTSRGREGDYAYFAGESVYKLNSWIMGSATYQRAAQVSGAGSNAYLTNTFTNQFVSTDKKAQYSVANYFGIPKDNTTGKTIADVQDVEGKFMPNSGIYGTAREGFSKYFSVATMEDGKVLNIMSLRKTYINDISLVGITTQAGVKAEYARRGMVATFNNDESLTPSHVYYPFKVLIYDSLDNGWNDASYVAIEFRITINNGAPILKQVGNPATVKDTAGREYTIDLATGNTHTINLYDIVSDPDIIAQGTNGVYTLATKAIFESSAVGVDKETGDYLDSPLKHNADFEPSGFDVNNVSVDIRDGKTIYYRNGGGFSEKGSNVRDVIMWMTRDGSAGEVASNYISFTVNRRTTAKYRSESGEISVTVNQYRFTLNFYDREGLQTAYITFIVNIANQSPTLTVTSKESRSFTMRAGDDLTVLTTYYDKFTSSDTTHPEGSDAYKNSPSYNYMTARQSASGYGTTNGDGRNNATGSGYWKFGDITSTGPNGTVYRNRDDMPAGSGSAGSEYRHLGYLGVASDDTPWRLRIKNVYTYSQAITVYEEGLIRLPDEATGDSQLMAVRIYASAACVNEPVTLVLSDFEDEEGVVTCTLYFTVISSPPVARNYGDGSDKVEIEKAGLIGVLRDSSYIPATFMMFTVPSESNAQVQVEGFDGTYTAKKSYTINMSNVARDPDLGQTERMSLYRGGDFKVGGVPLNRGVDGKYKYAYFEIKVSPDGGSFTLTATGYNPNNDKGYEELTFVIGDFGDSSERNTCEITLRVYTMYSDLKNATVEAMGDSAYGGYLSGANVVKVKSYDAYYSVAGAKPTRYAHMQFENSVGTDGNTASPILDADYKNANSIAYGVRLYAMFDFDGTGNPAALSAAVLRGKFTHTAAGTPFALDTANDNADYLIGGNDITGTPVRLNDNAKSRLNEVSKYVEFEFVNGGAAIEFKPVASTFGNQNMLLYIEVEKPLDSARNIKRTNAQLKSGTLFKLEVNDSAPIAVAGTHVVSGKAGDITAPLTIHNPQNPYVALFIDSDKNDSVTIAALTANDYDIAMRQAMTENPSLDWRAGENGKPQAFEVMVGEDGLKFKINRRIDHIVNGVYQPSVTFPVVLKGVDLGGLDATVTIYVTIHNTDISARDSVSALNAETGVGYTFNRTSGGEYVLSARLRFSSSIDIMLNDFIVDPDYKTAYDGDSYVFKGGSDGNDVWPYSYLQNEKVSLKWYDRNASGEIIESSGKEIATAEPIGNALHRTGIKLEATKSERNLAATMYVRILDRSVDDSSGNAGIRIRVDVTVMNDAPYVLAGKQSTTMYMIGSDKETPASMLFYIGDFVGDNNTTDVVGDAESAKSSTYLRIYRQEARRVKKIYSRINTAIKDGNDSSDVDSTALFTVTIPTTLDVALIQEYCDRNNLPYSFKDETNLYNQWFKLTPVKGFYGEGSIDITVADGDSSSNYDTLLTTFSLNIHVICDPDEIAGTLNSVTIACSKTQQVDIAKLMPDIENRLVLSAAGQEQGPVTSASANTFNQSDYYNLVGVQFQNSNESRYAEITRVGESAIWSIKAGNQVTIEPVRVSVKFVLRSDPTRKEYSRFFLLAITPNQAPQIKYGEITFRKASSTGTPDNLRDLDGSRSIRIPVWQLCSDADDPAGSAIRILDAKSQVTSLVTVSLEKDENGDYKYLRINFAARGESEITLTVTDETGTPITLKFIARNDDLPEASLWVRIMASFEANTMLWGIILGGVLLFLILLIIIIAIIVKRKRAREELEALLVSEMEIEEQMLRLAGGPSPTDFQSFGYLQSSGQPIDPTLMLDTGIAAQNENLAALPPPDGTQGSGDE